MGLKSKVWVWAVSSAALMGVLLVLMFRPESMSDMPVDRTIFLPGETTDGHYQIELECNACHTESFADTEAIQAACVECHGAELDRVDDSHPQRKFTDPRNADRVASLDARWCATCHQEHRPELTSTMGLSLPGDYCYRCHEDVGEERPTHADLPFDGCAQAGCHNFHDNKALYEDFLVEHRDEPWLSARPRLPERIAGAGAAGPPLDARVRLTADDQDAPAGTPETKRWVGEWLGTAHADSGVNCTDCHARDGAAWQDAPGDAPCAACHEGERKGFETSRHGMRVAAGLTPMRPSLARLPMHAEVDDRELGCNTCHPAHEHDTRFAAADACLECHADDHTLAWEASAHAKTWRAELSGDAPAGSGVSCATCHLPRVEVAGEIRVAHNQNDFLRPNDKMIRSSCMHCHGLGFALDALADDGLVARNYEGRPATHVDSIHFAAVLRWELEGRSPPWQQNETNVKERDE